MKKLIALIFILIAMAYVLNKNSITGVTSYNGNRPINIIFGTEENVVNDKKDKIWERINGDLFGGDRESFQSIKGPFLVELYNAKPKDSLAVNNILSELRSLIPNKDFDYFKNHTGIYLDEIKNAVDINSKGESVTRFNILRENKDTIKEIKGYNIQGKRIKLSLNLTP